MYVTREDATATCLAAMEERSVTWASLGEAVGRSPIWVAAVVFGQATLDADEATAMAAVLGLDIPTAAALQRIPSKGAALAVPTDPLLYRFHEINQTFGEAMKAVIHEEFGDGIMSAIDFEVAISRITDPKGDRVQVTYSGKFLPYRKF